MIEQLAAIVGPENSRQHEDFLSLSPANTDEVAAVLRFAHEKRMTVGVHGGGSKQGWHSQSRPTLKIKTERLNAVGEHTWQDLTCTVQAGCHWSSLQATLALHSQFVALDPLWPDRCTVGGVVATNDSGSLRLRYGGLRDLVIGMTIVLADGTIARSGGTVVKNVAGYDLHKLMIGAFGTLGVLTELTFRLHAIPSHKLSFTMTATDSTALGDFLMTLLDAKLNVQAMQFRSSPCEFNLDVQLAALPQVLDHQAHALAALSHTACLSLHEAAEDIWTTRERLFGSKGDYLIKATMLPSHIASTAKAIQSLGGSSVTQATGIMIAAIPANDYKGLLQIRRDVEQNQGSLTVLQQSSAEAIDPWGTLPDSLPLMQTIKRQFDPHGILNPGRAFGGI